MKRWLLSLCLVLLGAAHGQAECATPRRVLLGDSIAGRMREIAEGDGYVVLARDGARLAWAMEQQIGCVSELILVIGTNDLRDLRDATQARDYVERVRQALERWSPRRAVWVTPFCFDSRRNPILDRGSRLLRAELHRFPRSGTRRVAAGHDGGCPSLSGGDGVHPDPKSAAIWWARSLAALRGGAA